MDKKELPKHAYLVVLNREEICGEFKHLEDARIFSYICALHGDIGDTFEIMESLEGLSVRDSEDNDGE